MSKDNPLKQSSTTAPRTHCSVCRGEIQELPEHLYQFRNQTGNSVLFIQLTNAVPPKYANQKPKFVPAPICLKCVQKIMTSFIIDGVQAEAKIVSDKLAAGDVEVKPSTGMLGAIKNMLKRN